jgi:Type II secretion system (T2SS), protein E, N-terminal domain
MDRSRGAGRARGVGGTHLVKLGEMLVALSACPSEAIQEALRNQRFFGGRLGTNLIQMGAIQEAELADALARIYQVPCISGEVVPEPAAIALVPKFIVDRYDVVPYAMADRTLRLLMCDPRDLRALDEVRFATSRKVEPVVAAEARVWALMRRYYHLERGQRGIGEDATPRWAPRVTPVRRLAWAFADEV